MTYPLSLHQSSPGKDAPPCGSQGTSKDTHVGAYLPVKGVRRILLTVMVLFIAVIGFTQDSWQRISPLPQEQTLNAVATIPWNGNIIATGEGSTVMISDDEGESWEIMYHPAEVSKSFTGLGFDFIEPNTIFLYGNYCTILKSVDGGYEWEIVYQGSDYINDDIKDLEFVDIQHGFLICDCLGLEDFVFETFDSGLSWDTLTEFAAQSKQNVEFVNNQFGLITAYPNLIYKTFDSGISWTEILMADTICFDWSSDILFLNDSSILLNGDYYQMTGRSHTDIIKSTNYGETWVNVFHNSGVGGFHDMVFFNEQEGFYDLSFQYGRKTFLTNDGGISWEESDSYPHYINAYEGLSFTSVGTDKAISVGMNGATHLSYDKGATWQRFAPRMINGTIGEGWFFEDEKSFVHVYDHLGGGVASEQLYHSDDNGLSWFFLEDICVPDLLFSFLSPDTIFRYYNDFGYPTCSRSIDGGESWEDFIIDLDIIDNTELNKLVFHDFSHGVIPAWYTILFSVDGGENWSVCNNNIYMDVFFKDATYVNSQRVFAAGNNFDEQSAVWRSDDSGANWSPVIEIDGDGFEVVYFFDENLGFIAGYQNYIYRTNNSGNSWEKVSRPEGGVIYDIHFPSQNVGYAVGSGRILKTYNGGESWIRLSTNLVANLYTVHFFDENHGIVMGDNGIILRTDNGGTTFIEEQPAIPEEPCAITLFPNPVTDILNITFEDPQQHGELIFYNTNGIEVHRRKHNANVAGIIMNVEGMEAGAYVVQYTVGDKIVETSKIIIR